MITEGSKSLFIRAQKTIPGGVNSPVRAFKSVGGSPIFISSGKGAWLEDTDGNKYIDFVNSWGPLLFGHAHPVVLDALRKQMENGLTFGAPTELEVLMAEAICRAYPSMQKVRLVSSGTEATMSAIRVARGYTGRPVIVKFEGCYHGHADCLLAKSGSGVTTLGLPDSAGVPPSMTADTLTLPYNDIPALQQLFRMRGSEVAAVIVEPVAGNMGCVPPAVGMLQELRRITAEYGSVLIFDEVMTGFRLARGGAQELYGVTPDMTTLGKVIGGGMPVGAYGGKEAIMQCVAPLGPVYQAGTLSGNPMAVCAGLATLGMIDRDPGVYQRLERKGQLIVNILSESAMAANVPITINRVGSMFTLFFSNEPVTDYFSAKKCDTGRFARWFNAMLNRGIYLPPSQFEAAFISDVIEDCHIASFQQASFEAMEEVIEGQ